MAKDESIKLEGVVLECLPNATFKVQVEVGEEENKVEITVLCTLSGKMKMNNISVIPGDFVTIEVSPYDQNKGRIVFRNKTRPAPQPSAVPQPSPSPSSHES